MAFGKSQTDGKSRHGSRIGVIMLQNWPTRSRRDPVLLVEIRLQVRLDPFCRLWRLHHAGSESISRYDLRHASANTRLSVLSLSAFLVFSFEPNRREREGKRQKNKGRKKERAIRHCLADASRRIVCKYRATPRYLGFYPDWRVPLLSR